MISASLFSSHAALLTRSGVVYTWGNAATGRLGHGHDSSKDENRNGGVEGGEDKLDDTRTLPDRVSVVSVPTVVPSLPSKVRGANAACER